MATWLGDPANEALVCLLRSKGERAALSRLGVEIARGSRSLDDLGDLLEDIAIDQVPSPNRLFADAGNLIRQKWDWALPPTLLRSTYASLCLDLAEAKEWLEKVFRQRQD
ncbi:MAG: hypothetical protein U1A22_01950 [Xanthomonadaceae bacterium]|nr:hypothetical protein [Xanthomonadaceae bacterium]